MILTNGKIYNIKIKEIFEISFLLKGMYEHRKTNKRF